MTLFSRMSKDDEPYKKFKVELNLPVIRCNSKLASNENAWMKLDDYRSTAIMFDTCICYTYCEGYFFLNLSLLGFGVSITRQYEY